MTISGEREQTAGIQSRLSKVFLSFGAEKELFVFPSLFMGRSGEEWEENKSASSLGRKLL